MSPSTLLSVDSGSEKISLDSEGYPIPATTTSEARSPRSSETPKSSLETGSTIVPSSATDASSKSRSSSTLQVPQCIERTKVYTEVPDGYLRYANREASIHAPKYRELLTPKNYSVPERIDVVVVEVPAPGDGGCPPIRRHEFDNSQGLEKYLDSLGGQSNCAARYFFIDDLSFRTIPLLGSRLQLPLEFFEVHFDWRSRLQAHAPATSSTMLSAALEGGRIMYSIPWRRPCYMVPEGQDYLPRNTKRPDHDLGPSSSEHPQWKHYFLKGLCERLSVIKTLADGCETVVILTDRPPTQLREEKARLDLFIDAFPTKKSYVSGIGGRRPTYGNDILEHGFREHILSFIEHKPSDFLHDGFALDLSLFHAILHDCDAVVTQLKNTVNTVDDGIYGGEFGDEELESWRRFIGQGRKHMIAHRREITYAQQILKDIIKRKRASGASVSVAEDEGARSLLAGFDFLDSRGKGLQRQFEHSYTAMMASLSILESQKSIEQTISVNRLSELAFLFIPLTFVATVFGMNVEGVTHEISTWVLVSLILTVITYGGRMAHLSLSTSSTGKWVKQQIREHHNYRSTQQPQPTDYVSFFWTRGRDTINTFRSRFIEKHGHGWYEGCRAALVVALAVAHVPIWLARALSKVVKIDLTLLLASWLVFHLLGMWIYRTRRLDNTVQLIVIQMLRWSVVLFVWLGVVPVLLIWTHGRAMPFRNCVVLSMISGGLATAATVQCIRGSYAALREQYDWRASDGGIGRWLLKIVSAAPYFERPARGAPMQCIDLGSDPEHRDLAPDASHRGAPHPGNEIQPDTRFLSTLTDFSVPFSMPGAAYMGQGYSATAIHLPPQT